MKKVVSKLMGRFMTGNALAALVMLAGCSFHSNQWNALKNLLKPEKVAIPGRWLLSDLEGNIAVYPVQQNNAIVFTDGQSIFLKFDGWHFVEIRGYGVRYSEIESRKPDIVSFDYRVIDPADDAETGKLHAERSYVSVGKNKIVHGVSCTTWQRSFVIDGELLSQSCVFKSERAFSNSIWLDQSGNIRAIASVSGPGGVRFRVEISD